MNATAVAAAVAVVANSSISVNRSKHARFEAKAPVHASVTRAPVPTAAASVSTTAAALAPLRGLAAPPHWIEPIKVIKGIAFLSNVLLQLSPVRTVREIRREGSTLDYDVFPMFTLFICSLQWFFYGLVGLAMGDSAMVDLLRAYCGGVVLGAFYLVSYWQNCADQEKKAGLAQLVRGGAGLLVAEVLCVMGLAHDTALRVVGAICAFLSIVVTASPLVAIEDVFRTQSAASMQTDMVIVCFCGSAAWAILGFLMGDMSIAVSNCFGIVIGGLQVHLIVKFTEVSLWRKECEPPRNADTSALLRKLGGAPQKAGTEQGYEASVYLRVKIVVLVVMAHAHFVLARYAGFAADTLKEVCGCLSELLSGPPRGCGRCRWQRRSSRGDCRDGDSGENLGLL